MKTPQIDQLQTEIVSDNWYQLKKITYNYLKENGIWETHQREVFDRGNGAVVLLYNTETKNVLLTRQFRIPTYLNGNDSGMMIEACAGSLEKTEDPQACVIREAEEETGYRVRSAKKVFEAYMSPGAVTEILYFFIAEYSNEMKVGQGGGLASENENIEVLEMPFSNALDLIASGAIKDAKTIMLLQYAQLHDLMQYR